MISQGDELETPFAMIHSSFVDQFKRPGSFVTKPGKFAQSKAIAVTNRATSNGYLVWVNGAS
jgi:hypothetical protein